MKYKSFVCSVCSQDFSRKFSGYRHSRNLHEGQAKIVRMIDYVVGRISGEYQPANPSAYRSRVKQPKSTGSDSNAVRAGSFPFVSIAHDSSEKSSPTATPLPNENHETNRHATINSAQHLVPDLGNYSFKSKFDAVTKLCRSLYAIPTAEMLLKKTILRVLEGGGNEAILDNCLQVLRNQMNMKEASSLLFNPSIKEASNPPRAPLHNHHVDHLPESSRVILSQIELGLTGTDDDPVVWEKIRSLIKMCESTTDHTFLSHYLESCRRSSSAYGVSHNRMENRSDFSPQVSNQQIQSDSSQQRKAKSCENDKTYFENGCQEDPPPFSESGRSSESNNVSATRINTSSSVAYDRDRLKATDAEHGIQPNLRPEPKSNSWEAAEISDLNTPVSDLIDYRLSKSISRSDCIENRTAAEDCRQQTSTQNRESDELCNQEQETLGRRNLDIWSLVNEAIVYPILKQQEELEVKSSKLPSHVLQDME